MLTDSFDFGIEVVIGHHVDYKINPIVFILGENVARYKNMPYR